LCQHSTTQQQKLAAECWYSTHHFPRKNRRTPRLIRNASMANAIGIPITALGSVPRNTLRISPSKLIARRDTASQYPHRAPRHKPTAANAQAMQTAPIKITAHTPMPPSPARARGLSRQTGSRKLPGNSRDMKDTKLAPAPNKKNRLRAVIPIGRTSALVIVIVLVELCLFGINLLHHRAYERIHSMIGSRPARNSSQVGSILF